MKREISLRILDSILKRGLLLTAEERPFVQDGGLKAVSFIQQRACFTAIEPTRLGEHQDHFGDFSLEFEPKAVREFGALPAFYLTGKLEDGEMLNAGGHILARHLIEAYHVLTKLKSLEASEDPAVAKPAKDILGKVYSGGAHPFETVANTIKSLLHLYYPTDDASVTPLQFFEQREWKVVPCFAIDGVWHYPALEETDRDAVADISPNFFGAPMQGARQIDHCALFCTVKGREIAKEIRRIIVPEPYVTAVESIIASNRMTTPVVTLKTM